MGRHSKKLAQILAALDQAIIDQRKYEAWAATMPDDEKRKLYREYAERRQAAIEAGRWYIPSRPGHLKGLTCGARTTSGALCRMTALFPNGRCIWHGGKSTGPRTPEGRARALENLKLGRRKRGEATGPIK